MRARAAADVAASAYGYFSRLFSGVEPDIAVIVAGQWDWESRQPYGLPFFNDDPGQIRPGIVVMPAGSGDFWIAIGQDIRDASPRGYARLLAAYPDGAGGLDLQPFFDLITIHELGHAFEVLPTVGAQSRRLAARMRAEGYSTLEELEAHYTGGDQPMSALNYVWYQHRWLRLAARMFDADGEDGLVRFWNCFHATDRLSFGKVTTASLARVLRTEVSETLGRAIQNWR